MQVESSGSVLYWYCANCGSLVAGAKNHSGNYIAECKKCNAVVVRKIKGRRRDVFEVFAPEGTEHDMGDVAI